MTIFDQIQEVLENKIGSEVTSAEIRNTLKAKYGTNETSVILSDYCYNRKNDGMEFKIETRIFEYIGRNRYKYLGQNYRYTGKVVHKPINSKAEEIEGEWINGIYTQYNKAVILKV